MRNEQFVEAAGSVIFSLCGVSAVVPLNSGIVQMLLVVRPGTPSSDARIP